MLTQISQDLPIGADPWVAEELRQPVWVAGDTCDDGKDPS